MNILFIFTGGTIGSRTDGDIISTDPDTPYRLIDSYKRLYGTDFSYETISPYTILSENNDCAHLKLLAETVETAVAAGKYDGLVIAHGTDTLVFSADIISLLTDSESVPICFVSSAYPPGHPDANALDNLHAAVTVIRSGRIRGTVVPYRNHDNKVYIHRPLYLLEAQPFNDELFSLKNRYMATTDKDDLIFNDSYDHGRYLSDLSGLKELNGAMAGISALSGDNSHILHIKPFPGMHYPEIPQGTRCIIHESFHSGTINTASGNADDFFKKAAGRSIPVYLTGVYGGASYESTKAFDRMHLICVKEISPTAVYCRLMLG